MEAIRVCREDEGCCRCELCKACVRMRGNEHKGKGEPRRAIGERRESSEN